MQLYDTLFGVYPFQNEKYGHAQFNWGGGMEHQTITFVSGFDFDLISHELGHHWFGDKVTCNSWHDIWLNEGFATYLAMLCYEHIIPGQWLLLKQGNVSYITSIPDGSVYCPDTSDVNRIFDGRLSYTKGGMILNQLRWVIGDSAFFAGCNNYLTDAACAYGFASTDQFRQHMEAACGQNLSYYFDDWYTGEGYPSYHIDWTHNGGAIDLVINQTQSHSSVSFFELPVPIEFTDGIHDTIVRFDNTFNGQAFTANLPFTPTAANLDPNYELITANNLMTGISEYDLESKMEVFPNPTTNSVAIRLLHSLSSNAILTLTDVSGRQLMTRSVSGSLVNLDLSKFSSGTYFISIADSQKILYKTIIKQ
jgi:aminopeptidase N